MPPPEETGQDMHEHQPGELAPGKGADLSLSLIVLIAKARHAKAFIRQIPLSQ
jgi:hypothetical protein